MTAKPRELVYQALIAADGEIVGRTRLQKIMYLLDQLGLKSDLRFSYHHFGPYSRELDDAIDAAKALNGIKEITKYRSDGVPFSVFALKNIYADKITNVGEIPVESAQQHIKKMKAVSSTVIELAATIHWLIVRERILDWQPELERRKGIKTKNGQTEQAVMLLEELGLDVTKNHPVRH